MNKPLVNPTAESAVKLREIVTPRGVKAWLVEHILEDDYHFRDFLGRKKNAENASEPGAAP